MSRTAACFALGIASFLLLSELVLQVLPVSSSTATGYYLDPNILTYPPGHSWTNSTGWDLRDPQHQRSNNAGFLAHRDFERNPQAIALIGDSFVEASMLNADDRPGQQLERALANGRPVFTMGAPGSALLDYAERIRFAQARYGVRDFVLLMERGDVRQSICGSGNIHSPCLDPQTLEPRTELHPAPDSIKRILRHSALAQYVFGQLKFDPHRLWQQAIAQSRPVSLSPMTDAGALKTQSKLPDLLPAAQEAVVSKFFDRIEGKVAGKLVIVLDSDRAAIYRGQAAADPMRAQFISLARSHGAIVVDTETIFRAQLARSPLKFDVSPSDSHFNALGVQLVAQAAAKAIRGN